MMNKNVFSYCLLLCLSFYINSSNAAQIIDSENNNNTYQIGRMVQKIQIALDTFDEKQSLQIIVAYGTDSRYYMMIRGWLFQELVAVESQLYAAKKAQVKQAFQDKSNFLKKAIRAID
ncbi:hypothetical protein [Psychromonas sp. MME2]